MGKKIYVGNLAYSFNDQTLQTLFAEFGTVESAKVITDRDSGRSKGFGFVEMANENEAQNAIQSLNEKEVMEEKLKLTKLNHKKKQLVEEVVVALIETEAEEEDINFLFF